MKSKIYNILLLITLYGCGDSLITKEHTPEGIVIREYFPTKNIKSEGIYMEDDSTKNGWFKEYNEDGSISFQGNYKQGLENGLFITYNSNRTVSSKIEYIDGYADGLALNYDKNGKLLSESNWKSGKQCGESKFYYTNGTIKMYNVLDFVGEVIYVIKWDSLGNKTKEEGIVFSPNSTGEYPNDSIPLNKEVTISTIVATPPAYKTTIKIGDVQGDNEIKDLTTYNVNKNVVTYKKKYNATGKYVYAIIGEMRDEKNNIIKADTVFTDIFVR